ncbi:hypothetical protein [Bradyrhizobium sp.]|uniref:hypothetical protein n=1 Tax=Bradyrhizobium sp. TaxID=376 RepID=UPI002D3C9DFC|nr:hypothetical protein [Bradyrhizobium sp.]HZR73039.1 hypothetical protein [Bradyrhizobium sp.]
MKITLDISKLVEDGKLTPTEADRLKALASHETGSLAVNILIGFGVLAVAAGAVALVPTPLTAIGLGVLLFIVGGTVALNRVQQWTVLGQICSVVGALMFSGGVVAYGEGSLASMLIVTAVLALAALAARSSLLTALAVLAASACLGARAGYSHALYSLAIFEPTLTVVLFSALALLTYQASKNFPADFERIALTAARTSILLVNFGFWIGSLWGDPLVLLRGMGRADSPALLDEIVVPAWVFSLGWAVVLLAAALFAVKANRRWLVNTAAAFGAIHFYTQWFERLGATPLSVLLGGLLMLGLALALWAFNRRSAPAAA